jgi:DNA polymerase-3 subunit gamma/tau
LLKTLEEPPEYLKFVLATTDPDKMLPTVLSRCLQFNLRPMAPQTVHEHLAHVLSIEEVPHDAGSLRLLARAARGSMRDALSLTDQAIAYGGGRLDEAAVRAMLGSVERSVAAAFVEALGARDGVAVLAAVDDIRQRGLSAAAALEELAALLQQMAIAQAVPGALDDEDPDTPEATRLSGLWPADEVQLLYSIAVHGREELQLLNDEYAALTMVLLRFLAFPAAPPGALASQPPTPGATHNSAVVVETAATKPAAARAAEPPPWVDAVPDADEASRAASRPAPAARVVDALRPELQPTELGERWAALVNTMTQRGLINALVRELAMQGEWLASSAGAHGALWQLRVERESLRTPALRDKLQAAVAVVHGEPVELELIDGVPLDSPALREAAARARAQQQAEQTITSDPVVRELMAQFKTARIVPGSIKPVQRNPSP